MLGLRHQEGLGVRNLMARLNMVAHADLNDAEMFRQALTEVDATASLLESNLREWPVDIVGARTGRVDPREVLAEIRARLEGEVR